MISIRRSLGVRLERKIETKENLIVDHNLKHQRHSERRPAVSITGANHQKHSEMRPAVSNTGANHQRHLERRPELN